MGEHHSSVGVIGIGNMGLAIAQRLRDRLHRVLVRDIDGEREALAAAAGALVCRSPATLAAGCGVVIVAVVDAAQTGQVLFDDDGIASSLAAGSCVVLCPTMGPTRTEAFAEALAARGIDCIDAPMSGGPARARDGSMSLMVACADTVFERRRELLADMSSGIFRVGVRPGDGARTKLVNNLLAAVNLAGAAEAIALAERLGLDAGHTLAVIEGSSGQSWIGSDRMRRAIAGDLAPRAHTTLLAKDASLALAAAESVGFDARLGQAAAECFEAACRAGLGPLDDGSLLSAMRDAPSMPPD